MRLTYRLHDLAHLATDHVEQDGTDCAR